MPVGGIKEKVLAGHRAGLKRIVLPDRNRKDVIDIPQDIRDDVELLFVTTIGEALDLVFEPVRSKRRAQDAPADAQPTPGS